MLAILCLLLAADPLAQVFEKASTALSKADYAAAEAGFQQVLKASPKHIGALGNLGVVYSRTLRFDKAIEVYRRALALSPSDKGLLLNLGLAYTEESLQQQFGGISEHVRPGVLTGSDEQIIDRIGQYVAAGADQVNLALRAPFDVDAVERFASAMSLG